MGGSWPNRWNAISVQTGLSLSPSAIRSIVQLLVYQRHFVSFEVPVRVESAVRDLS